MPLLDLQNQLGINLDRWMLRLSSKQPFQQPSVCHTFEKEWLECSESIGLTRAKEECRLEAEDLEECMTKRKMVRGALLGCAAPLGVLESFSGKAACQWQAGQAAENAYGIVLSPDMHVTAVCFSLRYHFDWFTHCTKPKGGLIGGHSNYSFKHIF